MPNEIPPSPALSEASPNSLQHLFSLDPESYSTQDLDAIILEMRALRTRLDAANQSGQKVKQTRISNKVPLPAPDNPEDLGL